MTAPPEHEHDFRFVRYSWIGGKSRGERVTIEVWRCSICDERENRKPRKSRK